MKSITAIAMAFAAAAMVTGCASAPKQSNAGHGNQTDEVKPWIESRSDASKAFASQCSVGTVATAINAIGAPLQIMQRQAYDKVDVAYANYKGRRIWTAIDNDAKNGASKAELYASLSAEDKATYDAYQKYCKDQDFGERENQLKAMLPKLAQAGVEIGSLVVMAKKDPDFAKLAGLAMATQVRNVNKDADALKAILADTNEATKFWKALDEQDKRIQEDQKKMEAEAAK
ncbi:MAG: hypothetical protein IJT64_04230 [Kiritimatiellae bacterium]|nr:hypothetical protein [Kiritimatiellia bacterium]